MKGISDMKEFKEFNFTSADIEKNIFMRIYLRKK